MTALSMIGCLGTGVKLRGDQGGGSADVLRRLGEQGDGRFRVEKVF